MNDLTTRAETKMVSTDTWNTLMNQATELIKSGFLPSAIKSPAQAIAVVLTGRELGLGMMESFRSIDIIDGKPAIKPQCMLSLIHNSGVLEDLQINSQEKGCTVKMKRKGMTEVQVTFGETEAKNLNLLWKDNYKKQAKNMYRWRAIAACARLVCPDVIGGLYTPEEIESQDDDIFVAKSGLDMSEHLATDPDAYEKWAEETKVKIMDEINATQDANQIKSIQKKYAQDIGNMIEEDRKYIMERLDSAFQSIVTSDATESPIRDSVEEEGIEIQDDGTEIPIPPEKPKASSLFADTKEREEWGKIFLPKAVKEIQACDTTAKLILWKNTTKNIEGRLKCEKTQQEYLDSVLKFQMQKLKK